MLRLEDSCLEGRLIDQWDDKRGGRDIFMFEEVTGISCDVASVAYLQSTHGVSDEMTHNIFPLTPIWEVVALKSVQILTIDPHDSSNQTSLHTPWRSSA